MQRMAPRQGVADPGESPEALPAHKKKPPLARGLDHCTY